MTSRDEGRRPAVIRWDWREQPDLKVIASCIRAFSHGRCDARLVETGSDEYALVIHDHRLSAEEAQRWYDTMPEWDDGGREQREEQK